MIHIGFALQVVGAVINSLAAPVTAEIVGHGHIHRAVHLPALAVVLPLDGFVARCALETSIVEINSVGSGVAAMNWTAAHTASQNNLVPHKLVQVVQRNVNLARVAAVSLLALFHGENHLGSKIFAQ